jgi:molybdenum-dependent DNA-binding transcriptional regulator ModE
MNQRRPSRHGRGSTLRRWQTAFLVAGLAFAGGGLAGRGPAPAAAQAPGGMPDLRGMVGRPLPTPDLPRGTVVVRVSDKLPMNGVAKVEVTAVVGAPNGGELRKRVAKTGDDGRATFEGLPPGSTFKAEVTVGGERLTTSAFEVPAEGGARVLLIAGIGAASGAAAHGGEAGGPDEAGGHDEADEEAEGGDPNAFGMDAVVGAVAPADGVPAGTLELEVADAAGQPVKGLELKIGEVGADKSVKVHRATTDDQGRARFPGLTTGENAAYAAVATLDGLRLATQPFRMETTTGMRGRIQALARTDDPSVLNADNRSKIVVDLREDAIAIMQSLIFRNTSDKLFDPGPGGLLLPLQKGFVGAQEIQGGAPVKVRQGEGIAVQTKVAPDRNAQFAASARFGYILQANGDTSLEVRQPMPIAMESPLVLVPGSSRLTIEGPGIKRLRDDQDASGNKVALYELPAIPAGGALAFTVAGIAQRERAGQQVVAVLCVLLVLGAVALARPPAGVADQKKAREALVDRREALFAELVALERERREGGGAAADDRRRALMSKLEAVYRELAALDARGA